MQLGRQSTAVAEAQQKGDGDATLSSAQKYDLFVPNDAQADLSLKLRQPLTQITALRATA